MPIPPIAPEVVERICALYKEGLTYAAIAEEAGVADATVSRYLQKAGLTGSRRTGPKPLAPGVPGWQAQAIRMRGEGYGLATIASRVGSHPETIRRLTSDPAVQDEMYGLLDGRWEFCPVRRIQVWQPAA